MSESAGDVMMKLASGGLLIASGAFLAMLCGGFTGLALASTIHGAFEGATMTSYIDGKTTVTHAPGHFDPGAMFFSSVAGGLPTLLGLTAMAWGARVALARDGFRAMWSRCGWGVRLGLIVGAGLGLLCLAWGGWRLPTLFALDGSKDDPFLGLSQLVGLVFTFILAIGLVVGAAMFESSRRRMGS